MAKSYNRINNLLSSVGGKLSLATTIKYVEYCEDAWLLLRLRNYSSALADKETNCKYYFIDTGILELSKSYLAVCLAAVVSSLPTMKKIPSPISTASSR